MAHRCVRKLRLATPSKLPDVRHFHASLAFYDALAVPFAEYSTASSSSSAGRAESPVDVLCRQKAEDMRSLLSISRPSHNRVWASYIELLSFYGMAKVPLDIHQGVLRKCAPPASNVRAMFSRRLAARRKFKDDRLYESRFQMIIRNIRSAGDAPALEDYHCVLELFAAVGNHHGAMLVLQEIGRVGLVKEPKTYALCLQALCHRLTLPVWHLNRPQWVDEVTQQCLSILREMADNGIPYASYNVDLAFRIFKETLNMEGFKTIMRNAYGIDIDYPDRSPLEFWDKSRGASTDVEVQDGSPVQFPSQLPFTRAAFHTALDYLGRTRNISKLVQTFEVVTTPLPSSTSNPAFDDEDDDDFGVSNPQVAPFKPPHVEPNTTSFTILLRRIAKAGHFVLARHYVLLAVALEGKQNHILRRMSRTRPPAEIPSPRISINRSLLLPVCWLANRNKKMELLRWILVRIQRAIRWKRRDIEHFQPIRARWIESGVHRPVVAMEEGLTGDVVVDLPVVESSSQFSTYFNPSSSAHQPRDAQASRTHPNFGTDLDALVMPPPKEEKRFDIDLHLALLRRELSELEELEQRVETVIGRSTQRIKERLGRRVWGGKNVYLRDVDRRTMMLREVWRQTVNFHPQSEIEGRRLAAQTGMARRRRPSSDAALLTESMPESQEVSPDSERDSPPHQS